MQPRPLSCNKQSDSHIWGSFGPAPHRNQPIPSAGAHHPGHAVPAEPHAAVVGHEQAGRGDRSRRRPREYRARDRRRRRERGKDLADPRPRRSRQRRGRAEGALAGARRGAANCMHASRSPGGPWTLSTKKTNESWAMPLTATIASTQLSSPPTLGSATQPRLMALRLCLAAGCGGGLTCLHLRIPGSSSLAPPGPAPGVKLHRSVDILELRSLSSTARGSPLSFAKLHDSRIGRLLQHPHLMWPP